MEIIQLSSLYNLPQEVLVHILYFLDGKSLLICSLISKTFTQLLSPKVWRDIYYRDYFHFCSQTPFELSTPPRPIAPDPQFERNELPEFSLALKDISSIGLREQMMKSEDWKKCIIDKCQAIDLNGYWVGDYGKHGMELIRIYQRGYHVIAKKLTGDINIPAGKLTWKMHLEESLKCGQGKIQMADAGFENAHLAEASIEIVNQNYFRVSWTFQHCSGPWYKVSFANVRAGCSNFDRDTMGRKIDVLQTQK